MLRGKSKLVSMMPNGVMGILAPLQKPILSILQRTLKSETVRHNFITSRWWSFLMKDMANISQLNELRVQWEKTRIRSYHLLVTLQFVILMIIDLISLEFKYTTLFVLFLNCSTIKRFLELRLYHGLLAWIFVVHVFVASVDDGMQSSTVCSSQEGIRFDVTWHCQFGLIT